MSNVNRAALLKRLTKAIKKHYQPWPVNVERSVLEQSLFAACLENAHFDAAEEAFAAVRESFFDWNEVRVTTKEELRELMRSLHDPMAAANRLRGLLQNLFESTYSFDLDLLKKQGLGKAQEQLAKYGATPFMVDYVTQTALGGHAIPLDSGTLGALAVVGFVNDKQVAAGKAPGLERSVPKNKGIEFASQLHQLGAEFAKNPYNTALHKILLEIEPECGERIPKRQKKKSPDEKSADEKPAAAPSAETGKDAKSAKESKASKEKGKESAGKDVAAKDSAGKDATGKDAAKEKGTDKGAKEKSAKGEKPDAGKPKAAAESKRKPEPKSAKPALAKKKVPAGMPKPKPR